MWSHQLRIVLKLGCGNNIFKALHDVMSYLNPAYPITSPPSLTAGYALHAAEVLHFLYAPRCTVDKHAHYTPGTGCQNWRKYKVLTRVCGNSFSTEVCGKLVTMVDTFICKSFVRIMRSYPDFIEKGYGDVCGRLTSLLKRKDTYKSKYFKIG